MSITTKEDFSEFVTATEAIDGYRRPAAFGVCKIDVSQKDPEKALQARFLHVSYQESFGSAAAILQALAGNDFANKPLADVVSTSNLVCEPLNDNLVTCILENFAPFVEETQEKKATHHNIAQFLAVQKAGNASEYRVVFVYDLNEAPESLEDVYLRLYLYSMGKAPLRSINMNGAFGILPNVAWTPGGNPIDLDWLNEERMDLIAANKWPDIASVDKFPRMLQHLIPVVDPEGGHRTRILSADRVRMGAQLAPGTTIMPGASYVNFNAGTEGPSMVEGRISSSAKVGSGSDVGGGASILGVLSGGNSDPITIGANCLLGANSVTGISYGDGCIIDAGVAVLAGTKIQMNTKTYDALKEVNANMPAKDVLGFDGDKAACKARDLSGLNGLHFRQNSVTGTIQVSRSGRQIALNTELH